MPSSDSACQTAALQRLHAIIRALMFASGTRVSRSRSLALTSAAALALLASAAPRRRSRHHARQHLDRQSRAARSAKAVAVIGDRIVDVGGADEIERWRGANTTVIDAEGRRLVPGFNDAHVHFVDGGTAARQRRPEGRGHAGGVRAAHRRAREGEAGRVDPRRRLGRSAVDAGRSCRPAQLDRRRHQRVAGVRRPLRRPHGAGQLRRARPRRHHRADAGSAGRRDRARRQRLSRPASSRTPRWTSSPASSRR